MYTSERFLGFTVGVVCVNGERGLVVTVSVVYVNVQRVLVFAAFVLRGCAFLFGVQITSRVANNLLSLCIGAGQVPVNKCSGHQDSVYSLATNSQGSLVLSGSTERTSANAIGLIRCVDCHWVSKSSMHITSVLNASTGGHTRPLQM